MRYLVQTADPISSKDLEELEAHVRKVLSGDQNCGLTNFTVHIDSFSDEVIAKGLWFSADDLPADQIDLLSPKLNKWMAGESDPVLAVPCRVYYQTVRP